MSEKKTKQKLKGVSAKAVIYIITRSDVCGDEHTVESDPPMNTLGIQLIRSLKPLLPPNKKLNVICGLGRRYSDIVMTLNLKVNIYNPTVGIAAILSIISKKKIIIFGNGKQIPQEEYSQVEQCPAAISLINGIKNDTIICCGVTFLNNLGVKNGKYGSIYKITGSEIEELTEKK